MRGRRGRGERRLEGGGRRGRFPQKFSNTKLGLEIILYFFMLFNSVKELSNFNSWLPSPEGRWGGGES